ncbi:pteridine reductase, partial [Aeromonas caviae]|nr:pteridine reductase [Aeromonas caviae]
MRALVTGCGRRLGFYLCERLVAAGWQVTGSYRSERPELDRLRDMGVELVQADFTR